VPLGFLRRRKDGNEPDDASGSGPGTAATAPPDGESIPFDGLTEEWRLVGRMLISGRLTDVLNRREAIAISNVQWAPIDGSGPMEPAPGLKSIDPYDLIAVLAAPQTLAYSETERAAHRIRKVPYEVGLEVPPYRVIGTVHLHPGDTPDRLLDQTGEMFVPLTGAVAYLNGQPVADLGVEVVLVNRLYIRGVEATGR
jgi:hypothetical protein